MSTETQGRKMTQLDRIEAKLNYLIIKGYGWEALQSLDSELEDWIVP